MDQLHIYMRIVIHIYMYNTGIDAKYIVAEKRAAQSSILYSMRALTALTFKLKGAKEVIAKNDPTLHLLRISQIQTNPHIISSICKMHVNIEGGHGQNWKTNHNTVIQKLQTVIVNNILNNSPRFHILVNCFYNRVDGLPVNLGSRAYCKMDNMLKKLLDGKGSYIGNATITNGNNNSNGGKYNDNGRSSSSKWVSNGKKVTDDKTQMKNDPNQVPTNITKLKNRNHSTEVVDSALALAKINSSKDKSSTLLEKGKSMVIDSANTPVKFCCILSGQVMDDPIKHPLYDMHCDRTTLEIYKVKQEMKYKTGDVAIWPKSPGQDIPLLDIKMLETDVDLQNEIQIWRMENILKGSASSWPFGNQEDDQISKSSDLRNKK
jgi:hypothetical protein